ncbi:hypothetical protein NP233_g2895 [Leucocoprinus birnbaumii]|uniref:DUF6534 domain-containing protein n=1 Tax=Leucocoprinus birnbaumii TaxID=56174 RepID=A0AAD5YUF9_9AGAR|nr:hypothetical protein NP233_g2895 [Leucocoprinus birnbaumii]
MAAAPLPAIPSLDNSYGSIFIGMVVAAGLWGIGTAQAYWTVDTLHQAVITYLIYYYVVTNYFNPLVLDTQIWAFSIQSLFEIIPCAMVQSFFLMRIWRLSGKKVYLVVLPGLLIVAKMVLGLVWIGLCYNIKSISTAEARFGHISATINGLAAAGDILLSSTMVVLLHQARTGIRQSDNMLAKLMVYTINTGVITSLCSIVTLIVAVVLNKTFIYGAFYFCTGRLYVNTMLASLNARQGLKEQTSRSGALEMSPYVTSVRLDKSGKPLSSGDMTREGDDTSRKYERVGPWEPNVLT